MRKLLLTSEFTPELAKEMVKMLPTPPGETKVGFIATASEPETQDKTYLLKDRAALESLGFSDVIDIDLKVPEDLAKLDDCGLIFVEGGNTYYLLKWVRESKFDAKLKELLAGDKVYVGVSAGSIVVGTSIETAGVGPSADKNDVMLEDTRGLRQVPFMVAVHMKPGDKIYFDKFARQKPLHPIIGLPDGLAIICEGDRFRLVGDGQVLTWSSKLFR